MWLLLFISFAMSGCLLITLAIFGLVTSKEKVDTKEERVPEATPPIRQSTDAEHKTAQIQSSGLPDSISKAPARK